MNRCIIASGGEWNSPLKNIWVSNILLKPTWKLSRECALPIIVRKIVDFWEELALEEKHWFQVLSPHSLSKINVSRHLKFIHQVLVRQKKEKKEKCHVKNKDEKEEKEAICTVRLFSSLKFQRVYLVAGFGVVSDEDHCLQCLYRKKKYCTYME